MLLDDLYSFGFYSWARPFLSGRKSPLSIPLALVTVWVCRGLSTTFYLDQRGGHSEMIRNVWLQIQCVIYSDQKESCYVQVRKTFQSADKISVCRMEWQWNYSNTLKLLGVQINFQQKSLIPLLNSWPPKKKKSKAKPSQMKQWQKQGAKRQQTDCTKSWNRNIKVNNVCGFKWNRETSETLNRKCKRYPVFPKGNLS